MEAALLPEFERRLRGGLALWAPRTPVFTVLVARQAMVITNPGRNAALRNFPQQWSMGTAVGLLFLPSLF